jgi:uncharacterized protein (TIGR01370 family)
LAACSTTPRPAGHGLADVTRWWIVLASPPKAEEADWSRALAGSQLVIVNHDHRQPARVRPDASTIVLAYLSVGEAEMGRGYWPAIRDSAFVIERNPAWRDNVRVDIRDRRWQRVLLEEEAPRLLAAGYQGFMLDTLDTASYLEKQDPGRFAGSRQGLMKFLALFRATFPNAIVVANGTDTLVDAAPYVDGYVTEGIFATYESSSPSSPVRYRQTTPEERTWRLAQVAAAVELAPHPVFSIEYAGAHEDGGGLGDWAILQSRAHGFRPFVTTRSIDRLPGGSHPNATRSATTPSAPIAAARASWPAVPAAR